MEHGKFLELKKQYGLTDKDCDKPVSEGELKLISESHCDNKGKETKSGLFLQYEELKTYRGLIMTLVRMGRSQDAEKVCQKAKG